jgi:ELWxxDGT repeat protein
MTTHCSVLRGPKALARAQGALRADRNSRPSPHRGTRLVVETLEDRRLLSVTASLLKDIAIGEGSSPRQEVQVNDSVFFIAILNEEASLWKTDGTEAGTVEVSPLPGSAGQLTNVNGTLFFRAFDGVGYYELWKSDGTAEGTAKVSSQSPEYLAAVDGTLFFSRFDNVNGHELWKSDGAGTELLASFDSASTSHPQYLTNVNGTLFFRTNDGASGIELWKSDGTAEGTVLVKDINSGDAGSFPRLLTNVNGTLFFSAFDGVNGRELWKSDGTEEGTVLVKDILPGAAGSNIRVSALQTLLANVGGTVFFTANDGTHGFELWKSDGTEGGTLLVKDISPGGGDSEPFWTTNGDGTLFFWIKDGTEKQLWKSDGTEAGTMPGKDNQRGT